MPPEEFDNEEHLDSTFHWNKVADSGTTVDAFGIKAHHTICLSAGNGRKIGKFRVAFVKWKEQDAIVWVNATEERCPKMCFVHRFFCFLIKKYTVT